MHETAVARLSELLIVDELRPEFIRKGTREAMDGKENRGDQSKNTERHA